MKHMQMYPSDHFSSKTWCSRDVDPDKLTNNILDVECSVCLESLRKHGRVIILNELILQLVIVRKRIDGKVKNVPLCPVCHRELEQIGKYKSLYCASCQRFYTYNPDSQHMEKASTLSFIKVVK